MSQEKVDRYKNEKANRKKIMKKQKAMQIVRNTIMSVAALALIGWLGYSAYDLYVQSQPREVAEVDYTAIDDYASSLTSDDQSE